MPRGAGLAQRPRSGLALRRVASLWAGVGQRACRPTRNATSSRELAPVSPGWSPPVRSLPRGERSLSLLPQAVLPTQAGPESAVWRCAPLCLAHRLAAYTADGSRQISRESSRHRPRFSLPSATRALAAPGPRQVSGQARNADQSRLGVGTLAYPTPARRDAARRAAPRKATPEGPRPCTPDPPHGIAAHRRRADQEPDPCAGRAERNHRQASRHAGRRTRAAGGANRARDQADHSLFRFEPPASHARRRARARQALNTKKRAGTRRSRPARRLRRRQLYRWSAGS